jgi:hypothetical protein
VAAPHATGGEGDHASMDAPTTEGARWLLRRSSPQA